MMLKQIIINIRDSILLNKASLKYHIDQDTKYVTSKIILWGSYKNAKLSKKLSLKIAAN